MRFFIPPHVIFVDVVISLVVLDSTTIAEGDREKRYLVFPTPSSFAATKVQIIAGLGLPMDVDVSTIIGYVMKFNYALPYNASYLTEPYVRYERSMDGFRQEEIAGEFDQQGSSLGSISRWDIYQMIESSLDALGSGRNCLLRVICEAAAVPFSKYHGISPELIHVLLTPSCTPEPYGNLEDQEYHAAEFQGRKTPEACRHSFQDCPENILDYFTEIINDQ
ncbi:uncharacterized protein LOC107036716 [Diachasma alloeum]|uniref:uncharacterized protein LOC107036716 n=1 Tax=Diachasma alloeum TaxID=454923 RepID=UPI00073825CF|nr:uncharacterized protein LOC107036716 [Diachasma alloeum]